MYFASDCRWYCINYSFTNKYLSPVQLSGHNTVGQQLPALLDELGGEGVQATCLLHYEVPGIWFTSCSLFFFDFC